MRSRLRHSTLTCLKPLPAIFALVILFSLLTPPPSFAWSNFPPSHMSELEIILTGAKLTLPQRFLQATHAVGSKISSSPYCPFRIFEIFDLRPSDARPEDSVPKELKVSQISQISQILPTAGLPKAGSKRPPQAGLKARETPLPMTSVRGGNNSGPRFAASLTEEAPLRVSRPIVPPPRLSPGPSRAILSYPAGDPVRRIPDHWLSSEGLRVGSHIPAWSGEPSANLSPREREGSVPFRPPLEPALEGNLSKKKAPPPAEQQNRPPGKEKGRPKGASEEPVPVKLTADEIEYLEDSVEATGNVRLDYGEMTITSKSMTLDRQTTFLTARKDVVIKQPGERIEGSEMTYDLKGERGFIKDTIGQTRNLYYSGDPIRGDLFFEGDEITTAPNFTQMLNASTTTCDLPKKKRHYRLTAREIDIFPGDRMILHHAGFWLGDTKLYGMSHMVISLREKKRKKQPFAPEIGWNRIDGYFIKNQVGYFIAPLAFGSVLLDYFEKTGTAFGIQQNYPIPSLGQGDLFVYSQRGNQTDFERQQLTTHNSLSFGGGLSSTLSLDVFRFQIPPFISPDTVRGTASVTKVGKRFTSNLVAGLNTTVGTVQNLTMNFSHSQNFADDLSMNLTTSFFDVSTPRSGFSNLHSVSSLTKRWKDFDMDLMFETTSLTGPGSFLDRTPEVVFRSHPLTMPFVGLPYQFALSVGKFFESARNLDANRLDFQFALPTKTWELVPGTTLSTSFLYRQDLYTTPNFFRDRNFHAQYALGSQVSLTTELFDHFNMNFNFRTQSFKGFTPLPLDTLSAFRYLSGELTLYNRGYWKLSAGTAFDFRNNFYQNLVARLEARPIKDWFIKLDANYDPNQEIWRSLLAAADLALPLGFRVQYWGAFDLPRGKVSYQDFAIYKDLHCWEARLAYRWQRQELFFSLNIKAFPQEETGLGLNPQGPMIDPTFQQYVR